MGLDAIMSPVSPKSCMAYIAKEGRARPGACTLSFSLTHTDSYRRPAE